MIINDRKDVVTNKRYKRSELIRVAILKDGSTLIDKDYSLGGRGIYIHKTSIELINTNNYLKGNINRFKGDYDKVVELLIKEVDNG